MADRSLRGMRLGSQSLQSEEGVVFSPRIVAQYRSNDGTTFEVTFSEEAEVPQNWTSPKSGKEGVLLEADGTPVEQEKIEAKAATDPLGHAARATHTSRAGRTPRGATDLPASPSRQAAGRLLRSTERRRAVAETRRPSVVGPIEVTRRWRSVPLPFCARAAIRPRAAYSTSGCLLPFVGRVGAPAPYRGRSARAALSSSLVE